MNAGLSKDQIMTVRREVTGKHCGLSCQLTRGWLRRFRRFRCFCSYQCRRSRWQKTLVAGQLLAYDIGTARDGRSKAINLRLQGRD
jgi:hypothetical protein